MYCILDDYSKKPSNTTAWLVQPILRSISMYKKGHKPLDSGFKWRQRWCTCITDLQWQPKHSFDWNLCFGEYSFGELHSVIFKYMIITVYENMYTVTFFVSTQYIIIHNKSRVNVYIWAYREVIMYINDSCHECT